jgi:uncharacterized membrane protein
VERELDFAGEALPLVLRVAMGILKECVVQCLRQRFTKRRTMLAACSSAYKSASPHSLVTESATAIAFAYRRNRAILQLALSGRAGYDGAMVLAAKTTSQVILHMAVAFGVMYAVTGSLAFGGLAAVIEPIVNVVLLPLHERAWIRIQRALRKSAQEKRTTARPRIPPAITVSQ